MRACAYYGIFYYFFLCIYPWSRIFSIVQTWSYHHHWIIFSQSIHPQCHHAWTTEIIIWFRTCQQTANLCCELRDQRNLSPQLIKKNLHIFGRGHIRTRIAEFADQCSTTEPSDRLMRRMVFNEILYLDSSQIELYRC